MMLLAVDQFVNWIPQHPAIVTGIVGFALGMIFKDWMKK